MTHNEIISLGIQIMTLLLVIGGFIYTFGYRLAVIETQIKEINKRPQQICQFHQDLENKIENTRLNYVGIYDKVRTLYDIYITDVVMKSAQAKTISGGNPGLSPQIEEFIMEKLAKNQHLGCISTSQEIMQQLLQHDVLWEEVKEKALQYGMHALARDILYLVRQKVECIVCHHCDW